MTRILIVQTGSANVLIEKHGDYPAWFTQQLDPVNLGFPLETSLLRAHEGEKLSRESLAAHKADGILITGSPLSVTAREPWMLELGDELWRAAERGVPVLGVCFGHQLLCETRGVSVVKNPRGREIGTVEVQLTAEGAGDPLFAWAGEPKAGSRESDGGGAGRAAPRIAVQATHVDAVYPIPAGATLLASNENTPVQALRFQEHVASVQFHPELRPETMRDLIDSRRELLARESLDADRLIAKVRETGSPAILRAFAGQVRRA